MLLLVIIVAVSTLDTAIRGAADLLLELGVGDFGRRFDVIRTDNVGHSCRSVYIGLTRHAASNAKQLKEIVELTMDVTADRDRGTNGLDVGFFCEGEISIIPSS